MPRRYKMLRKVRRAPRPFTPMVHKPTAGLLASAEHRVTYPSHEVAAKKFVHTYKKPTGHTTEKFTVAIAYNKGAYQVIPDADIQHIGK